MTPMTLYTAGPMTGHPQFNFPLFDVVALSLRDEGFEIVSPAELDDPATRAAAMASPDGAPGSGGANGETWGDFLARDVKIIADQVDGVALIPGWEASKGARLEAFICRHVGKPVFYVNALEPVNAADLPDDWPEGVYGPTNDESAHGFADAGITLVELDDTELDAVLTVGDLSTLLKIEAEERMVYA